MEAARLQACPRLWEAQAKASSILKKRITPGQAVKKKSILLLSAGPGEAAFLQPR
jgi:hypothetical protein